MEKNLLSRILSGDANTEEKQEFYRNLGDSKEEEELFYEVKSLWLRTSRPKTRLNTDAEFENLWKKINLPVKRLHYLSEKNTSICSYCPVYTKCWWLIRLFPSQRQT